MAQFTVNSTRIDPYQNVQVPSLGRPHVAGVSKASALKRTTEVVAHRDGGDPTKRKSPGCTEFEPITIERGITHDPAFEKWAIKATGTGPGLEVSLKDFRKDIIIELYNLRG